MLVGATLMRTGSAPFTQWRSSMTALWSSGGLFVPMPFFQLLASTRVRLTACGEILEPLLLFGLFEEGAEIPAQAFQVSPHCFVAVRFATIRVVDKGRAEIRAIVVIRQHHKIGQLSE